MSKPESFIVADIGGTNARFAIASMGDSIRLEHRAHFLCSEHANFASVFAHYLEYLPVAPPGHACLAVAGPAKDNRVTMTNLTWVVDGAQLAQQFDLDHCHVINDFTAQSCATLVLGDDGLSEICAGESRPNHTRCVVGPGTGLGVGAITPIGNKWLPFSSEGGHATLSATGNREDRVIRELSANLGPIQAEDALSGPGLRRLYRAVCEVEDLPGPANSSEEITQGALAGNDIAAMKTFDVFFRLLGGFAGDMALTFDARGGVFLAGGILPRIEPLLQDSGFETCFRSKGTYAGYMEEIRVSLITEKDAALLGAAEWVNQQWEA